MTRTAPLRPAALGNFTGAKHSAIRKGWRDASRIKCSSTRKNYQLKVMIATSSELTGLGWHGDDSRLRVWQGTRYPNGRLLLTVGWQVHLH